MFESPKFTPKLTMGEAHNLVPIYVDERELGALKAGDAIRAGRSSRDHLNTIFVWKTRGRGKNRLLLNSEDEIREALRLAAKAEQARSAIAVLTGLYGVNIPVASAIATAIHPDRFTIIDFRALHALGHKKVDNSLPFYLAYRGYCIELAAEWNLSLRNLDRALWQWSKNHGKG